MIIYFTFASINSWVMKKCLKTAAILFFALLFSVSCKHKTDKSQPVTQEEMQAIYNEVKTPYKVGMIIEPEVGESLDNPCVFRYKNLWYMMYVRFDGKGYETHLAKSEDLIHWKKLGLAFERGSDNSWDASQADGWPLMLDEQWEGSNQLKKVDNRYWIMYIGGHYDGYETDPLSTGLAWSENPTKLLSWNRYEKNPIFQSSDSDARAFEKKTIYKHYVVEDPSGDAGGRYVDFYNAKQEGLWIESIGMATSNDLKHWQRVGKQPVICDCDSNQSGISGDPMIRKIGNLWVMFYFGYKWLPGMVGAFDTFACSRDLLHWTKWTGKPLVQPSEPWDKEHAHKPWVIKHEGVVYHFYCAVGESGRGLALATSKPINK